MKIGSNLKLSNGKRKGIEERANEIVHIEIDETIKKMFRNLTD